MKYNLSPHLMETTEGTMLLAILERISVRSDHWPVWVRAYSVSNGPVVELHHDDGVGKATLSLVDSVLEFMAYQTDPDDPLHMGWQVLWRCPLADPNTRDPAFRVREYIMRNWLSRRV